jgi:glucosamine 6-phosphate synthetase-like amidotransferase/phosphosugar isomerase protein
MCGMAGMILAQTQRPAEFWQDLTETFTDLLWCNEERGKDATGVAWVSAHRLASWHKSPLPAQAFLRSARYQSFLREIPENLVALIGHTRWATQGDPAVNRNNHPLICGPVLGTHNGTIVNATWAFKRMKLPRDGAVDSEVIFRIAERHTRASGMDVAAILADITRLSGYLSAVITNVECPTHLLILKGNRPLSFRVHPDAKALAYASDDTYLQLCCPHAAGWRSFHLPAMHALEITCDATLTTRTHPLRFNAHAERVRPVGQHAG